MPPGSWRSRPWARGCELGDGADGPEILALDLVLVGQAALALALTAVMLQVDYVASVASPQSRQPSVAPPWYGAPSRPEPVLGRLVIVAGIAQVLPAVAALPAAAGWFVVGAAWTLIGFIELADAGRRPDAQG